MALPRADRHRSGGDPGRRCFDRLEAPGGAGGDPFGHALRARTGRHCRHPGGGRPDAGRGGDRGSDGALRERGRGAERTVSGVVRIACPPDVAEVVVAPLLPGLISKHRGLRIEIAPGETVLDLTRHEADIALRTVRPVRGDLVVTRLSTVRWVPVAAPTLSRALGTLDSWADAPWVGWGERLSSIAPARWLAAHAREVEPVVRSDSLMLQLALVRKGAGVALVPEPSAEHYGLVPVKTSAALRRRAGAWPTDELFLVTHRALRQVPRVRVVWDLLVARQGRPRGQRQWRSVGARYGVSG